jgi:hypothetical protein
MKEALKLALEALEFSTDWDLNATGRQLKSMQAITALRQALAQPAQEPVAWLDEEKKIIYWHNTHETDDYHGFRRTTPLYTTPQQRHWVGLTEAQFLEATRLAENGNYLVAFVRIQEWLKEKNT